MRKRWDILALRAGQQDVGERESQRGSKRRSRLEPRAHDRAACRVRGAHRTYPNEQEPSSAAGKCAERAPLRPEHRQSVGRALATEGVVSRAERPPSAAHAGSTRLLRHFGVCWSSAIRRRTVTTPLDGPSPCGSASWQLPARWSMAIPCAAPGPSRISLEPCPVRRGRPRVRAAAAAEVSSLRCSHGYPLSRNAYAALMRRPPRPVICPMCFPLCRRRIGACHGGPARAGPPGSGRHRCTITSLPHVAR